MFQRLFTKSVPQQRLDGAVDHLSDQEAQEALKARSAAMMQRLERKSSEARRIAAEEQEARIKAITTPPIADDGVDRETQAHVAEPDTEMETPVAPVQHQSAIDDEAGADVAADASPEPGQDTYDDPVNADGSQASAGQEADGDSRPAEAEMEELRRTAEEAKARIAARLKTLDESGGTSPQENDDRVELGNEVPPLDGDSEAIEVD